jgi:hypothetical protein
MEFKNKWFEFSDKNFPIVEFTFSAIEPNNHEIKEMLNVFDQVILLEGKMCIYFDLKKLKYLSSEARIEIGKWNKQNYNALQSKVHNAAFLMDGVIPQMMLKAIYLVQQPPYSYQIYSKLEDIEVWREKVSIQLKTSA